MYPTFQNRSNFFHHTILVFQFAFHCCRPYIIQFRIVIIIHVRVISTCWNRVIWESGLVKIGKSVWFSGGNDTIKDRSGDTHSLIQERSMLGCQICYISLSNAFGGYVVFNGNIHVSNMFCDISARGKCRFENTQRYSATSSWTSDVSH